MASIKFSENTFYRFIAAQVRIYLSSIIGDSVIPKECLVVKHMKDSSKLNKGRYHSWTEYWEDKYPDDVIPENNLCSCCQRIIKKTKSNYFVVGHVETSNNEKFLYPVCNDCNVKMKKWSFLADKNKLKPMPMNL